MSAPEERQAIGEILRGIEHPVIVELGAHVGEEYEWLSAFRPSRYIMVEADVANHERIANSAPGSVELVNAAISSHNGLGMFYPAVNHKAHNRASGSTRPPTGHLKHFPEVEFGACVTVPHMTLNELADRRKLPRIDLLWVDIQGAERDMIASGRETLKKTRYMMIEAEPEVELYEGQALKPELLAMLPDWEVIQDFGYNLLMRNTVCI